MKKPLIIFALVLLVFIIAASFCIVYFLPNRQSSVSMANPASEYCAKNEGLVDIRTAQDGSQTGYCIFTGGECEEWAYFRGECQKPTVGGNTGEVACTADAKMCSDGSYVGRTGPKCEFAPCPVSSGEGISVTIALGNTGVGGGVYITPIKIIEDSRCKPGVQCFWAGRLILEVKLKDDHGKTQTFNIEQGIPTNFVGKSISFQETSNQSYKFTVSSAGGTGSISGTILAGPACPVTQQDLNCADKPVQTDNIKIFNVTTSSILKTIASDANGNFNVSLPTGSYTIKTYAKGGAPLPRCNEVVVEVKSNQISKVQISCDTGIR